ncbi:NAD(P)-dependent dehydrogenase (short-subunit alcohol dehydrogenase family) [Pedobacter cryoconitis]|uniref:NAD(P)-dependent dehydrogenase (Short-subunit alcohol dehydrogenase family) n=1 Tax=Pedobacter cryoconitis TaxID=188932 RepID=A0A7W8ZN83_9SPHI|nr:SDR family oxidoreductase [Pedobacter cryoconitis]MBB5637106.1 NAD(P)-dependent dehydrogenase (short-subunit alcohol dehydrogenase family) [Pedobacter cryoconitis]
MENTSNKGETMAKTILITGASSGFGKETAKLFQQKGWNVIATMRSPEKEQDLNELENILVTKLDVQDSESINHAIKEGITRFGRIDALLNNAGYGLMGVFESATKEQIQNQYAVNVFGLMNVTQAVLPFLRENGQGTIINVSTFGGITALPFGSLYNSSKFAVEGFSESLSHELSSLNIAVKIIEPGGVSTNFRNGIEMIKNEIPDYGPILATFFSRYATATAHLAKATAEDVAATIYQAATDQTKKLRYVVGDDAQFYIDARMKNSDEEFVKQMRDYFID